MTVQSNTPLHAATPQTQQGGHLPQRLIVAVDGPAAAGKGTLAVGLARRMGLGYLDTGALYRAVALAVIESGGNTDRAEDAALAVDIVRRNLTPEFLSAPDLRRPDVAATASKVAAMPVVRQALLDFQRDFARNPKWAFTADGQLTTSVDEIGGAVIDGRDIGTVVCPDAHIKFFVTADPAIRAKRRHAELLGKGVATTLESVAADMAERDRRDSTREAAPSRAADDAYILDTSHLDAEGALDEALAVIRARFLKQTAA